jgi:hypothetical protein
MEMSYDDYNAHNGNDNSPDMGDAGGKPLITLKQIKFSLKQITKRMVQANNIAFNKCKQVWVGGFLEKKY